MQRWRFALVDGRTLHLPSRGKRSQTRLLRAACKTSVHEGVFYKRSIEKFLKCPETSSWPSSSARTREERVAKRAITRYLRRCASVTKTRGLSPEKLCPGWQQRTLFLTTAASDTPSMQTVIGIKVTIHARTARYMATHVPRLSLPRRHGATRSSSSVTRDPAACLCSSHL